MFKNSKKLRVSPVSRFLMGNAISQNAELCKAEPHIWQYTRPTNSGSQKTAPESRSLTVHAYRTPAAESASSYMLTLALALSLPDLKTLVILDTIEPDGRGDNH